MAEQTGIEWCDHTFNPWTGCTKVSPGCRNCYAETLRARFGHGGESGPNARPMRPEWVRAIRDQCVAAGVPFLFKQWGEHDENGVKVGKKKAGRIVDGRLWDEYPRGNDA